jgi:hypothetical protein
MLGAKGFITVMSLMLGAKGFITGMPFNFIWNSKWEK